MHWADIVNALFEGFASLAILAHVLALYKAKTVKGVSIGSFAFFALWGIWNLIYYPLLGQMASFGAGILVVSINIVWVVLALRYRRNK